MIDFIKSKVSFVKEKLNTVAGDVSDPVRVMILEHRLQKSEDRVLEYQGLYHIYLRQLTILNRAMQRKSHSIKNLRLKIKRMESQGIIDPEKIRIGRIPLERVSRPNGEDISPDAA